MGAGALSRPPGFGARSSLGGCRSGAPGGAWEAGLGGQDAERAHFLLNLTPLHMRASLHASFPRTPTPAFIAHGKRCENESMPSRQAEAPAGQACTGRGGWELGNHLVLGK